MWKAGSVPDGFKETPHRARPVQVSWATRWGVEAGMGGVRGLLAPTGCRASSGVVFKMVSPRSQTTAWPCSSGGPRVGHPLSGSAPEAILFRGFESAIPMCVLGVLGGRIAFLLPGTSLGHCGGTREVAVGGSGAWAPGRQSSPRIRRALSEGRRTARRPPKPRRQRRFAATFEFALPLGSRTRYDPGRGERRSYWRSGVIPATFRKKKTRGDVPQPAPVP